jgi:hypothetical protein
MPVLELTEGEVLTLEAIDPTTGAAVAGVVCQNFIIYARSAVGDDPTELTLEQIYLTPISGEVATDNGAVIRPEPIPGRGD